MVKQEQTFEEMIAEADAEFADLVKRKEASNRKVQQLVEEGRQERRQFARDMKDIASGKEPKKPEQVMPGLDEMFSEADALIKRSKELSISQKRLLDEMAANPLEAQCDAVYAEIGQQLTALTKEERDEAGEANRFLKEDAHDDEAEDALEKSGQPPPLQT